MTITLMGAGTEWREKGAGTGISGPLRDFARDGFAIIEDFFDSRLMDDLDGLIRRHFGDTPEDRAEASTRR